MLKRLNIQNFKCFLNQDIDFGRITVLAGANGVGKSTVVQALLLKDRCKYIDNDNDYYTFGINDKQNTFLELSNIDEIINTAAPSNSAIQIIADLGNSKQYIYLSERYRQAFVAERKVEGENNFSDTTYLNAERLGPRNIQELRDGEIPIVGFQGELTGHAMKSAENTSVSENRRFIDQMDIAVFHKQVEAWMNFLIPDIEIQIKSYEEINQVRIGLRKKHSGTDFLHPNNIGFGISYVLPVVVAGLLANEGDIFIVENPDAHLHPSGQSRIGQFLAKMAGAGVQVVVETHSEHVVNGIRLASLKNWVNYDNVIFNFFSQEIKGDVKVEKIELNAVSDPTRWPVGFFDQAQRDVLEILQLKRAKSNGN